MEGAGKLAFRGGILIFSCLALYWKTSSAIISSISGRFSGFFYRHLAMMSEKARSTVMGRVVYLSFSTFYCKVAQSAAMNGFFWVHSS
jgi:hypothetical protein